jgi:hypothetical protein
VPDQSYLDERYFIDENVYNCPFCNRRHVSYVVYASAKFDWTDKKECFAYFVRCVSCGKQSMHLTFGKLLISELGKNRLGTIYAFAFGGDDDAGSILENTFFYSVPTSFFVLDERVPRVLRELLTEAEGCLKSNYLTGASACARKIVYELGVQEEASGENYEDRIKSLKHIHSEVEGTFFDTLLTVQQLTSSKVHENSLDGWEAKHLRIILATLKEVLHEIYIVPALREDRRKEILALKEKLIPPSKPEN